MVERLEQVLGGRPGAGKRWAFMDGFSIGVPGDLYLDRLRVIQTPWGGIYLHRIHRADMDPDPHDHPWPFTSIVLSGCYTELIYPDKTDKYKTKVKTRYRWSVHSMSRQSAHKISHVKGILWTLVLVGPRLGEWGFYPGGKFVPWKEYTGIEDAD